MSHTFLGPRSTTSSPLRRHCAIVAVHGLNIKNQINQVPPGSPRDLRQSGHKTKGEDGVTF
jgi:hypothetical protein